MKLSIGYPERDDELELLADGQLAALQDRAARVAVSPAVRAYLVDLGRATRSHPQVALGLSPRGLLIWQRVAQAWAFLQQRPFVTPDDVQQVAAPFLGVRLGLAPDAAADVWRQILESAPVPV
jgi:MoxR-like ATPase